MQELSSLPGCPQKQNRKQYGVTLLKSAFSAKSGTVVPEEFRLVGIKEQSRGPSAQAELQWFPSSGFFFSQTIFGSQIKPID